ncbi:ent-7 [Pristionchus pacificus]|uniref:Ent-7 n=1 Tax=Pristionchus pacificus TaxID=54126 RepID=A0A2A6BBV0_PRIPA|nr:ent-7 [Pristionchus pacificus]|eukprot:PDM63348.1 ent-7 [Pristionchus pacificus]
MPCDYGPMGSRGEEMKPMKPPRGLPPTERDPMLSKIGMGVAPRDVGFLVYIVLLLNGLGVLLPWNMFITIAPQYYVQYWFTGANNTQTEYSLGFMNSLGVASQLPNLSINIINIFLAIGGSLLLRIIGPLVLNCFNVAAVLVLIAVVDPSEDAMGWYYMTTLIIVAILNASNGLYQNSIFGLTADFPQNYTNAIVLGNNLCGIFTTVLNIGCTLIFRDDIKTIALLYFSISLSSLVACGVTLMIGSQRPFYEYYIAAGERARAEENTEKPSLAQYIECFKGCWVQLFNVFFTFFVTLTVFPSMLVSTPVRVEPGQQWDFFISEMFYVQITTFLNFNLFAVLGSFAASFVQFPSERFLWMPVLIRVAFLPLFLFMNYLPTERTLPVFFDSPWIFIISVALLALSHGYFSSLGMMYSPRVVNPSLSKIAGMTAAMMLILGITAGVTFGFVMQRLAKI